MMTLYDFMGSGNGYKVRLLLAQLGAAYKLVEHDILKGETRTPEFLAKNANGRIPTLELEDGTCLAESCGSKSAWRTASRPSRDSSLARRSR